MILTLHRYVLRQLVGTIVMCWLAMTLVVTLGGGIANLFRGEGFGAVELAKLFILFSPAAATMVLPVAAMFGAAITFGRMSADNEITACRAAGINIHRLFWPVLIIGLIVSGTTYYSWNFLIPSFIRRAEGMTEKDIGRWAALQLQKHRTLSLSNYRLHADSVQVLDPDPSAPDLHEILLGGVAFLQLTPGKEVMTYGTAREATVTIAQSRRQRPLVSAELRGVRTYQPKGQYGEVDRLPVEPREIPRNIRERLGFLSLTTLLDFQKSPHMMAEVADQLARVRRDLTGIMTCDDIGKSLNSDARRCTLVGRNVTVALSCDANVERDKEGAVILRQPSVKLTEQRRSSSGAGQTVSTWYRAQVGRIEVDSRTAGFARGAAAQGSRQQPIIQIRLDEVTQTDRAPDDHPQSELEKRVVHLPPLDIPPSVQIHLDELSDPEMLEKDVPLPMAEAPASQRPDYVRKLLTTRNEIIERTEDRIAQVVCLIHFRTAVALSGLALVALAAMLGLIFRGSHVLTAFGLSCVPALFVFLAIMAGRNVGKTPEALPAGLGIMWGVCVLLALSTLLVGARGVRR